MPPLTVWTVRIALIYLAGGFTIGAAFMTQTVVSLPPWATLLRPLHIELLLIGWLVQLAMGVAFWILPRFGHRRGRTAPAVGAVVLLNIGLWLVGTSNLWACLSSMLPFLGRICEALAALLFGIHIWTRVKPARTRTRGPVK